MVNCGRFERRTPSPAIGARYGELVVIAILRGKMGGCRGIQCRCSCGREIVVAESNLRKGATSRCSTCGRAKAAETRTRYGDIPPGIRRRLNGRISSIYGRCLDENHRQFPQYGGRGITVFKPWVEDRHAFLRYLASLPGCTDPQLTIDRIDNNQGYEPGNLRFVSIQRQQHNRTNTNWVEYQGRRMSGTDFWKQHCPGYARVGTVLRKIREGRTPEEIIEEQARCKGPYGVRPGKLRAA